MISAENSRRLIGAALLGLLIGCNTIFNAREAQMSVEAKTADDYVPLSSNRIDLVGYSLEQLVDFAMTNRPSVVSKALAVADARLALEEINANAPLVSETPWTAPNLKLTGTYSETSRGMSSDNLKLKTEKGTPSAGLSLELPLWDFGRHNAEIHAQAEKILAAELQLIDHGYEVFYEVASAYFTLLEKGALMEVAHTNEYEYALQLEYAQRRYEAGDVRQLDVQMAKYNYAQAKEDTVSAANDVRVAGVDLMRSLGIDAAEGTREEVMNFEDNALCFVLKGFPETSNTVAEAFSLARTNSPSIRLARANLRAASAKVDYAVADLYPEVSANATFSWVDPLWYFSWGASAVQTLFQGFGKTTAVDRSVVALRQSESDLETAEQTVSLELEEAIANRDNACSARYTAMESMRSARENLRLAEQQLMVGDISRVDFTDSVADYTEAMGSAISTFYRGQRAEAAIFSLIGIYPVYQEKKIIEELK